MRFGQQQRLIRKREADTDTLRIRHLLLLLIILYWWSFRKIIRWDNSFFGSGSNARRSDLGVVGGVALAIDFLSGTLTVTDTSATLKGTGVLSALILFSKIAAFVDKGPVVSFVDDDPSTSVVGLITCSLIKRRRSSSSGVVVMIGLPRGGMTPTKGRSLRGTPLPPLPLPTTAFSPDHLSFFMSVRRGQLSLH